MPSHNIKVEVILDAINPDSKRITTLMITMPKFLVAQLNTHRVFSRNSASSRAVPVLDNIKYVLSNPVSPDQYGNPANGAGMKPKKLLTGWRSILTSVLWKLAMWNAVIFAYLLSKVGLHKQWNNRLLEPFALTTVLVTSTEWVNFLNLRAHGDAQDAMQQVAFNVASALNNSVPEPIYYGDYYLPYVGVIPQAGKSHMITSVSCCAQVSFRKLDDSFEKAQRVVSKLLGDTPHWSPFEHAAICSSGKYANFTGFKSLRYAIEQGEVCLQ